MLGAAKLWVEKKMMPYSEEQRALELLEKRIKAILPEQYQESYEDVQPVSMGSAALKYGEDGKVAWSDIWDTFCDLAMAGGPPHKGRLLEPASAEEISADAAGYEQVTEELCRGIRMVTDLHADVAESPGWVAVECQNRATSGWLLRAVTMENVSCRAEGSILYLPAGPAFRVEKEIKNVVTVMAKTCHYFLDHMWASQQRAIGKLFEAMAVERPLICPLVTGDHDALRSMISGGIQDATGLVAGRSVYSGWQGFACPDVRSAIWMMRALVASNILSRREETTLFLPIHPATAHVIDTARQVYTAATVRGILPADAAR